MQATDHYRAGRTPSGRPGLVRGVLVIVTAVAVGAFVANTGLDRDQPDEVEAAGPLAEHGAGESVAGNPGDPDGSVAADPAGPATSDAAETTVPASTSSTDRVETTTTTTAPTVSTVREPDEVKVLVLNAAGKAGIAGAGSEQLEVEGYDLLEAGNADEHGPSAVLYTEGFQLEAGAVADVFGVDSAGIIAPLDLDEPPMDDLGTAEVIVLIGSDGLIEPA